MHVLFFTTGMTAGGSERVVATLANALTRAGHRATIAMLKGEKSHYDLDDAVELRSANLRPGAKNFPKAVRFYHRLVTELAPDTVASFATKANIIVLLSRLIHREPVRLIITDRADPYSRSLFLQFPTNLLSAKADLLVCQSNAVAKYYERKSRQGAIEVIVNPLNPESISTPHDGTRASKIITTGRLSPQKNQRLAIDTFVHIRKKFPEITMEIFGEGPLRPSLQRHIDSLGLNEVVSLRGVVPDVMKAQSNASLFLFTSLFEGYPNALLEAAATGIPAVTTNFSPGTASEIIAHGTNGLIVDDATSESLAAAAASVLSGELSEDGLRSAAAHVQAIHSLDRILSAWMTAFSPIQQATRPQ